MSEYNLENYEYKTVLISWEDQSAGEQQQVDVVIGDGKTVFDENFPYDQTICFYFHDKAEYESAKGAEIDKAIGFRIVSEI